MYTSRFSRRHGLVGMCSTAAALIANHRWAGLAFPSGHAEDQDSWNGQLPPLIQRLDVLLHLAVNLFQRTAQLLEMINDPGKDVWISAPRSADQVEII
jgi:hypothetical protein